MALLHQAPTLPLDTEGKGAPSLLVSSAFPGSRQALCLWIPTFELRLELVRAPELDATSVALLAPGEGTRRTLWQVSERGAESGARPGQLLSQAISLCPSLTLLEPDPTHYDAAQEELVETLMDLSPVVEPAGPGRVFLGMDGLERLHGPPPHQVRVALQSLLRLFPRPLVASTRVGRATGKFGAWVASARSRPGRPVLIPEDKLPDFLAGCPVSVLPVDPLMIQRLERLGISTLAELIALPEPALVGQFGNQGRKALEWSTGRRIDPVRPLHRPRPIRVSLSFPAPAGRTETLHGALDHLMEKALARPVRRGRSVQGVRLRARLEGGGSWSVESVIREPTARKDALTFPLRGKMALSPPPRAVESLAVELFQFGPATSQPSFFQRKEEAGRESESMDMEEGMVPPALQEAIRELKLKLGFSPLYRVVEMDPWSRIPERRYALLNFEGG
jgi:nucleotidyltransferase/DNA polymerase involved in DNA repair